MHSEINYKSPVYSIAFCRPSVTKKKKVAEFNPNFLEDLYFGFQIKKQKKVGLASSLIRFKFLGVISGRDGNPALYL